MLTLAPWPPMLPETDIDAMAAEECSGETVFHLQIYFSWNNNNNNSSVYLQKEVQQQFQYWGRL